ncbi:MAG: hypothetical protein GQ582_01480 [Methyloprofundus sp.]|nr:hypothetical protein [Methyloprofundus sp.]
MTAINELNHAMFEKYLEHTFQVLNESFQLELVLTEAVLLAQQVEQQQGFSLLFKADNSISMEQGLYSLQHKEMGEFALFLVPISQDQHSVYYEAIFN